MSRRAAALLLAACVAILLGTYWLWRRPAAEPELPDSEPEAEQVAAEAETAGEAWIGRLWFPADSGRLEAAEVALESDPAPAARARVALAALLAAQPEAPLAPVFPMPVEVHKVLYGASGTLFVDLRPPDGSEPPGAGSAAELQRVYSIVHTALDAVPEATGVAYCCEPSVAGVAPPAVIVIDASPLPASDAEAPKPIVPATQARSTGLSMVRTGAVLSTWIVTAAVAGLPQLSVASTRTTCAPSASSVVSTR